MSYHHVLEVHHVCDKWIFGEQHMQKQPICGEQHMQRLKYYKADHQMDMGSWAKYDGRRQNLHCQDKEMVIFEDVCEDCREEACYSQNEEDCKKETFKICTSAVRTNLERKCFDVEELVCGLNERIDYSTLQEVYFVQMCSTVEDGVGDTTFDIALDTKDDFLCTNLNTNCCKTEETVMKSVIVMMMTSGDGVKYNGSLDYFSQTLKTGGFMLLMRGTGANVICGVAGAGVLAGPDRLKELYIKWRSPM